MLWGKKNSAFPEDMCACEGRGERVGARRCLIGRRIEIKAVDPRRKGYTHISEKEISLKVKKRDACGFG